MSFFFIIYSGSLFQYSTIQLPRRAYR